MSKIENVVIAAAGFGSRLGRNLPKCMVQVGDKLILDYIIEAIYPNIKNIILVTGYKSEAVEKYCSIKYPFIKIIINNKFSETNTAYSFSLGSADIKGKCLFLDGDLILSPNSVINFIEQSEKFDTLLGVTNNITENPVFVEIKDEKIISFTRNKNTGFEWANIFCADSRILDNAQNYVYEELAKHHPLHYFEIILQEVDTEDDFLKALEFIHREKLHATP